MWAASTSLCTIALTSAPNVSTCERSLRAHSPTDSACVAVCFKLWDADGSDHLSKAEVRDMLDSAADCGLALAELVLQTLPARAAGRECKRLEVEVRVGNVRPPLRIETRPGDLRTAARPLAAAALDDAASARLADVMMEGADANRDGRVSRSEFRAYVGRDPAPLDMLLFYARLLASPLDPTSMLASR